MTIDSLSDYPQLPEWRRSGYFFLLALLLHGAVLAFPLSRVLGTQALPASPTLQATLMPAPQPVVAPSPVAKPVQPANPTQKKIATPPRPVIAVAASSQPSPATFSVPAPVFAAPAAPSDLPATSSPAPVISAARYNAAYLQNPQPAYPSLSRRLGEEGKVLLKVKVTAEGQAAAVDLEKSSNFSRLDEAARQAVSRWRFVPARRGDEAIEATVIVPIVFRLEE